MKAGFRYELVDGISVIVQPITIEHDETRAPIFPFAGVISVSPYRG